MPENITLSTNLVNAIMQYLSSKPFAEVNSLIQAIQTEAGSQVTRSEESTEE